MLRPVDARRTRQCRVCHLRSIAHLGWQATVAKHGREVACRKLVEKQQAYRLENPSSLEVIVEQALQRCRQAYQREALVEISTRFYLVDFLLVDHRVAIEVNGNYAHRQSDEYDAAKHRALAAAGYAVMVITEDECLPDLLHARFAHLENRGLILTNDP